MNWLRQGGLLLNSALWPSEEREDKRRRKESQYRELACQWTRLKRQMWWGIDGQVGVSLVRIQLLVEYSRTGHGTTDWFQIGKGVRQGYILSPCLFNLYAEYIMRNAELEEAQAGIKIAGRNISNLKYADDTTLNGRKWRGTKKPLVESERGEWKRWLKA